MVVAVAFPAAVTGGNGMAGSADCGHDKVRKACKACKKRLRAGMEKGKRVPAEQSQWEPPTSKTDSLRGGQPYVDAAANQGPYIANLLLD